MYSTNKMMKKTASPKKKQKERRDASEDSE